MIVYMIMLFAVVCECGEHGNCSYGSSVCECDDGYYGYNCNKSENYVFDLLHISVIVSEIANHFV